MKKIVTMKKTSILIVALVIAALAVFVAVFSATTPATALPGYVQPGAATCGACHVDPAGGGPLTALGQAFVDNGHVLPTTTTVGETTTTVAPTTTTVGETTTTVAPTTTTLPPAVTAQVTVQVVDDAGNPINHAKVVLRVRDSRSRVAYTDSIGTARFASIPYGAYTLVVSKQRYIRSSDTLVVDSPTVETSRTILLRNNHHDDHDNHHGDDRDDNHDAFLRHIPDPEDPDPED